MKRIIGMALALMCLSGPTHAGETVGTFSWQLFPFCNVLTLLVVVDGDIGTLSGFDDNCGIGPGRAAFGTGFANADGTVGIGLTILNPTGLASQVQVQLSAGGTSGSWSDDGGQSGAFLFGPGASPPGALRPQVAPASDTWHEIGAPGEPPFGEGWKNDTPPYICGGPLPHPEGCPVYATAGFYKDALGIVRLKGTISTGQDGSTVAFRLPPGYRPAQAMVFTVATNFGGRFVLYDGYFQHSIEGGYPPGTFYFSLDGISFRAEK